MRAGGPRRAADNALDGDRTYVLHFPADRRLDAVVDANLSIILVSLPGYRVVPNPEDRFNLNSYSPLVQNDDGSLDLFFSPRSETAKHKANWLTTPDGAAFSLTVRTYVPKDVVKRGKWFPQALEIVD